MKIILNFIEPVLGTTPFNQEVYRDFIMDKSKADEEEVAENLEESLEKSSTGFPKENDKPFFWNYQIKGFFKDAWLAIITSGKYTKAEMKKYRMTEYMYKRTIDHILFVNPRKIFIELAGELSFCERPLRAQTMRGERIALARSEQVPAGSSISFELTSQNDDHYDIWEECLDYGKLRGLGQWRNSGMGCFSWKKQ